MLLGRTWSNNIATQFNSLSRPIMLRYSQTTYGRPIAYILMRFRSYLSGRTYRVVYAGGTSSVVCTSSARSHKAQSFGPVLFVLYVADLADIVNRHGVTLHSFADDMQLYLHCCRDDITTAATRLKRSASSMLVAGCPLTGSN